MFKFLPKVIPVLVCWGIFVYALLQIPYPNSLTQATAWQLLSFFIPLFLALTFTLNLFLKFYLSSSSISLGIIFLLFLKALDTLSFVSAGLTIIAVGLLLSYFRKAKRKNKLTISSKIPKLTSLQRKKQ